MQILTVLLAVLLLSVSPATAANWYIRPSAKGANSGVDWNNAWTTSSIKWASVAPGDTLWLAGGTYSTGLVVMQSGSSSAPIMIKRVLASDIIASTSPGWSSSFDSLVNFATSPGINLPSSSFVEIDGRINYGIRVTIPQKGGDGISGGFNGDIDSVTFRHIEILGPYTSSATSGVYGINLAPYNFRKTNITISDSWVHGICEGLRANNWNNVIVERNVLEDFAPDGVDHEDVLYAYPSSNVIFRYNIIRNSPNDGIFFEFGGATNFYFYGNLYLASDYPMLGTKSDSGRDVYGPIYIFNNIFQSNTPTATSHASIIFKGITNATLYNNIFINVANAANVSHGTVVSDYNAYNYTRINGYDWNSNEPHSFTYSGDPFVNSKAGDYHLNAGAPFINKGISLQSDGFVNFDRDGVRRGSEGAWDLGAYEYGIAGSSPSSPINLRLSSQN